MGISDIAYHQHTDLFATKLSLSFPPYNVLLQDYPCPVACVLKRRVILLANPRNIGVNPTGKIFFFTWAPIKK